MNDFLKEYGIATLGSMTREDAVDAATELAGELISNDIAMTAGYGDVWTRDGSFTPTGVDVNVGTELDTYVVTKIDNLPGTVFHDIVTDETIARSYTREAIQFLIDNSDEELVDLEDALAHEGWNIIRVSNTPNCVNCKIDLSRFE